MGCILRVYGEFLDIEVLLPNLKLIPVVTWRKGQERFLKGRLHVDSGANFVVSDADIDDFPVQITDAQSYLTKNHAEILKLTSVAGAAGAVLDFAVATRQGFATQTTAFSPEFLACMTNLRLGLAVSHYPTETNIDE